MRAIVIIAGAFLGGILVAFVATAVSHAHRDLCSIRFKSPPVEVCDDCDEPARNVGWRAP